MKNELEVLNRNICVQGCTFSRTGLRFDVVDESTLASAGACLQEMGKAADWWWGDYLVAWAEFKIKSDGAAPSEEADKEKLRRFWVRNHASVLNGGELEQTQFERYWLASFYNYTRRRVQLSKFHHEEAMKAAHGDPAIADEWLDKAERFGWSPRDLRAEVRAQTRKERDGQTEKPEVKQQWLFDARMGAAVQMNRVDDMDADEAAFLLAQLAPVLALANALAAKFGPMHKVGMGGKESITSAARQR